MFGELSVLYDGGCGMCQRSIRILSRLDWFHVIRPVDVVSEWAEVRRLAPELSQEESLREMHVVSATGKVTGGFYAFRRLARSLPSLWIFWPLLYVPPVPWIARRVYRYVAERRCTTSCSIHSRRA